MCDDLDWLTLIFLSFKLLLKINNGTATNLVSGKCAVELHVRCQRSPCGLCC
jgi:hypothetical protein